MISAASLTAVFNGNSASSSLSTRCSLPGSAVTSAGCSTSTNSPRLRFGSPCSQAGKSLAATVAISSNCFVNSRPMVMDRGPKIASAVASASMRCGASSRTTARASLARASMALARSLDLEDRKPTKTNSPCCAPSPAMPATLRAAVTLLAPGSGITGKDARRTAATSRAPGSLMAGVPASLA